LTISYATLSGSFEYPPRTLGFLIKKKWTSANTGSVTPEFIIPREDDIDTGDPWTTGVPPEIVFRKSGSFTGIPLSIGNGMYKIEFGISIHLFSSTQRQEFLFEREIKRILQEFGRNPILKYSTDYDTPPTTAVDSGWKNISPEVPDFRSEDPENLQTDYITHSVATVNAIYYEHRI